MDPKVLELSYEHLEIDPMTGFPKGKVDLNRQILQAAQDFNIDLSQSYMIGDSPTDIAAGQNAGCKESILIETNQNNALLEIIKAI